MADSFSVLREERFSVLRQLLRSSSSALSFCSQSQLRHCHRHPFSVTAHWLLRHHHRHPFSVLLLRSQSQHRVIGIPSRFTAHFKLGIPSQSQLLRHRHRHRIIGFSIRKVFEREEENILKI